MYNIFYSNTPSPSPPSTEKRTFQLFFSRKKNIICEKKIANYVLPLYFRNRRIDPLSLRRNERLNENLAPSPKTSFSCKFNPFYSSNVLSIHLDRYRHQSTSNLTIKCIDILLEKHRERCDKMSEKNYRKYIYNWVPFLGCLLSWLRCSARTVSI